jgi:hypothetical protein
MKLPQVQRLARLLTVMASIPSAIEKNANIFGGLMRHRSPPGSKKGACTEINLPKPRKIQKKITGRARSRKKETEKRI